MARSRSVLSFVVLATVLLCFASLCQAAIVPTKERLSRAVCNAVLKDDRAEVQETVSIFWRELDNHNIDATYFNWTAAQKFQNAALFAEQFFTEDATFEVGPYFFSGRANISSALAQLTAVDNGGRRANNGDIIYCNTVNDFTTIRDSIAFLRGISAGPGTVSLNVMTTRTSVKRENAAAPFKVYEVYNEVLLRLPVGTNVTKMLPVMDTDFRLFQY